MKASLETVRGVLLNQISGIPEHVDVVRVENGRDVLFLLDATCGNTAIALMEDVPADIDLDRARCDLIAALTVEIAVRRGRCGV